MHNNRGITMLALVITIVILLLLAAVTIQLTLGNDGIIAKSTDARIKQAKTELIDTARVEYSTLNMRATANDKEPPTPEMVLEQQGFLSRYNIVGENITDKNGNVIATKEEVLNSLRRNSITSPSSTAETQEQQTPVAEEDKDKMILKLIVKNDTEVDFTTYIDSLMEIDPIELDYGNGEKENVTDLYNRNNKHYNVGEYILKLKNIKDFGMQENENYEIEILQWGRILEKNEENIIQIPNVIKIYEPEPDRIPIEYINPKFTEIPEWLFSKKVTSTVMSKFGSNNSIVSIPEGLFKNNVNVTTFSETFYGCTGITNIPEGLFKNNVKVTSFGHTFYSCTGLTSIPETIVEFAKKVKEKGGNTYYMFVGCTSASNYASIPNYMK